MSKSNLPELGGWHSRVKLHRDAAFAGLVEHVDNAAEMMCRELGYHRSYRLNIGTMWSIVNPPGGRKADRIIVSFNLSQQRRR